MGRCKEENGGLLRQVEFSDRLLESTIHETIVTIAMSLKPIDKIYHEMCSNCFTYADQ